MPPGHCVVAAILRYAQFGIATRMRPDKYIDGMLASLVYERSNRMAAQIVDSSTDQRIPRISVVLDRWREIQFAVEPGLDGVLVARRDVGEMVDLQRAHMVGDDFVEQRIAGARYDNKKRKCRSQGRRRRDAGKENRQPHTPA